MGVGIGIADSERHFVRRISVSEGISEGKIVSQDIKSLFNYVI